MTAFARQHPYRIGRSLVAATALLVLGSWLFPVDWLRVFGHRPTAPTDQRALSREPWIRLIPSESLPEGRPSESVPIRITIPAPDTSPDTDPSSKAQPRWSFDPTTAFRPLAGSAEPLAGAVPDSVVQHAAFLHAMRLANLAEVFALLDTTQTGRAREQLAETDRWVNRVLGPMWRAEGHARFQSDLWWRVVGEVEAEGSH